MERSPTRTNTGIIVHAKVDNAAERTVAVRATSGRESQSKKGKEEHAVSEGNAGRGRHGVSSCLINGSAASVRQRLSLPYIAAPGMGTRGQDPSRAAELRGSVSGEPSSARWQRRATFPPSLQKYPLLVLLVAALSLALTWLQC